MFHEFPSADIIYMDIAAVICYIVSSFKYVCLKWNNIFIQLFLLSSAYGNIAQSFYSNLLCDRYTFLDRSRLHHSKATVCGAYIISFLSSSSSSSYLCLLHVIIIYDRVSSTFHQAFHRQKFLFQRVVCYKFHFLVITVF